MAGFREVGLSASRNPDFSVTPLNNGLWNLFRESDGIDLGNHSKEAMLSYGFSEYQLSKKGTRNYVLVGRNF